MIIRASCPYPPNVVAMSSLQHTFDSLSFHLKCPTFHIFSCNLLPFIPLLQVADIRQFLLSVMLCVKTSFQDISLHTNSFGFLCLCLVNASCCRLFNMSLTQTHVLLSLHRCSASLGKNIACLRNNQETERVPFPNTSQPCPFQI